MKIESLVFQRGPTELVGIEQGFSWPAFLLGSLWAFVRRAWLLGLVLLALEVLFWICAGYAAQIGNPSLTLVVALLGLGFGLVRGIYGSRWLQASLIKRGFVLVSNRS